VPKVSFIMGAYNCERYIKESMDSMLSQDFEDFEIVVCDDGSKDRTLEMLKCYEEKWPDKVVVIQNEKNKGLNATLNSCIAVARGEYLARQDADDLSCPKRIRMQLDFLKKNPGIDFVSSDMLFFDADEAWGSTSVKEFPVARDFLKSSPFCHAPTMFRRECLISVNGYREKKRLLRVEDYDLFSRLYAAGFVGANIKKPLYSMRDGREAEQRRAYRFRVNAAVARLVAYSSLNFPFYLYPYAFRPLIVGALPKPVYRFLRGKRLAR